LHGIDLVLEAPVGRARLFRYDRQRDSLNALNLADAVQLTESRCLESVRNQIFEITG
jgi:hypothetical protein